MKKLILFLALCMSFFMLSCSNETTKENKQSEMFAKNLDDGVLINVEDENYDILKNFGDFIIKKYTYIDSKGSLKFNEVPTSELEVYLTENVSEERRPRVICNVTLPGILYDIHYVVVQASNGLYYSVEVNTFFNPPKARILSHSQNNPC